ncbi:MAG: DsrE family protein [Flavobacteriales bacterium]
MKTILLVLATLLCVFSANAQEKREAYKIVFQLVTNDTLAHKALMKQLSNITLVEPATQIEVVCHGPGLAILHKDKSAVKDKIGQFSKQGVSFNACEFSMKERNVSKDELISEIGFVKAGILHIVERQSQGWFYIKAGF